MCCQEKFDRDHESFGYTERLHIGIAPWNLPISELTWGRYLSNEHTVIWIRWSGALPKCLVYHNGICIPNAIVDTESITWSSHELRLPKVVMRNDTIGKSVFRKFTSIMKMFPSAIMGLRETKWCGTGTLFHEGKLVDSGVVIHELVRW